MLHTELVRGRTESHYGLRLAKSTAQGVRQAAPLDAQRERGKALHQVEQRHSMWLAQRIAVLSEIGTKNLPSTAGELLLDHLGRTYVLQSCLHKKDEPHRR